MAWTKNLGRVKGETGDVYIPSVELVLYIKIIFHALFLLSN